MKSKILSVSLWLLPLVVSAQVPHDNLENVFESLQNPSDSPDTLGGIKSKSQNEFDLGREDVTRFLIDKMNKFPERGVARADTALKSLMKVAPEKTLQWMLDHYESLNPHGRSRLIDALRADKTYVESFEILFVLLDDTAEVTNLRAAQMWTGPFPYFQTRVCDSAYGAITLIVGWESGLLPPDLPKMLGGHASYEARDQAIQSMKKWWAKDSGRVLASKTALKANSPSIEQKVKSLRVSQTK